MMCVDCSDEICSDTTERGDGELPGDIESIPATHVKVTSVLSVS